jgi:hypothetical protein
MPLYRRAWPRIFLFLSVFLSISAVRIPAAAQDGRTGLTAPGSLLTGPGYDPASSRVFGAVESYYRHEDAVNLGVTWDRVIFYWYDFQPSSPVQFRTDHMPDSLFAQAQAGNRQIVGIIKGTPTWASAERLPGGVPFGLDLPISDPRNFWAAFVRRLVAYYAPFGVHHWIIWNEPDTRVDEGGVPEWLGTVEDFADVMRVAYRSIKAEDPTAHVQIPGMLWWADRNRRREPYLSRLLRILYNDPRAAEHDYYFDGIGVHLYFTTNDVWPTVQRHREILQAFGLGNKEIWLDEYNASPRRDPAALIRAPLQTDLQQQADYIVQASAIALAAGVDRMAVYRLYDNHFTPGLSEPWGLVRGDGSLRPAFFAYQQVITRFAGAQTVQYFHIREGTLVTFHFPAEDRTLYVVWSDTFESGEFLINANRLSEPVVRVYDAQAEARTLPIVQEGGASLLIVDAPAARRIDWPTVVTGGAVRLFDLPGGPRTVWYRDSDGQVTQLR